MSDFWRRKRADRSLERRLRSERPTPSDALVARIVDELDTARARPSRRLSLALAGAVTTAAIAGGAATGGVGYAATAVQNAVDAVKGPATAATGRSPAAVHRRTAGSDQYRPGYGFGDPNHNHTGPPGLVRRRNSPPARAAATRDGLGALVTVSFVLDEQASLRFNVFDSSGEQLLLTQTSRRGGTTVGNTALSGPQTKVIRYVVLVPRTITMSVRIPANLLRAGETYRLRIRAIDATGNRTELTIPFTVA